MVLVLPLLEQAVRDIILPSGNAPIVVADYGSSQGKNSVVRKNSAIEGLRKSLDADRPIAVAHVNQTVNDFNTLFQVLEPKRITSDAHQTPFNLTSPDSPLETAQMRLEPSWGHHV